MKSTLTASLAIAIAATLPVSAQQKADDHAAHHPSAAASAVAGADMVDGEVRRVDKDAAKLTLRHAEIRNLDMPAMTMVFTVRDRTVLDRVRAGDKVKFRAVNDAGQFTVTELEVVR